MQYFMRLFRKKNGKIVDVQQIAKGYDFVSLMGYYRSKNRHQVTTCCKCWITSGIRSEIESSNRAVELRSCTDTKF